MAQEVEATIIDSPEVLSGAEMWLAEVRGKVADRLGNYFPHEIVSVEDYKQSKRDRTALRKDISEIDAAKKAQTRAIKDAVRAFETSLKDVLDPLTTAEAEYREHIEDFERRLVADRRARMAECFADYAGALADSLSFDTLSDAYSAEGKWYNLSTLERKAIEDMQRRVSEVADNLTTLANVADDAAEETDLKAEYLSTLDMSGALRAVQARKEQRERVKAMQDAVQSYEEPVRAALEPEPQPTHTEEVSEPEKPSERVLTFEVTVPESKVQEFRAAMMAIGGVHGHLVR